MSCSLTEELPKPKTISVNGIVIPRETIAQEVQNHPAKKPIDAWQAAARALVVKELLRQETERLNLHPTPCRDDEGRIETSDEAAIRELVAHEVKTPEPDEDACRRFYQSNAAHFRSGDLCEAAHILLAALPGDIQARKAARAIAEKILEAVKAAPDSFADFAADHSDCLSSAQDGGRLGQISHGQTVAEFDAALSRMNPGDFAIAETRYGFHVIRLDRRVAGRSLPFERVRDRIADYLATSVSNRAVAQYISILAGRAQISGISFGAASSPLVQ
ncbi:MAG: peptidylprolyl isomerase [Pseudomonadota bacterium]